MVRDALRRLSPRSLRLRLSIAFTLLVAGLLLVADGGLIGYTYYTASVQANRALSRSLILVRTALLNEFDEVANLPQNANASDGERISPALETLREMEPALVQEGASVLITDGAGHEWRGGARTANAPSLKQRDFSNAGWRTRSVRISPPSGGADATQSFTVTVGVWWPATEIGLRRQAFLLCALSVFMVLVAGFGAFILIGRTLLPIDRLAQQAGRQAASAFPAGEPLMLTPPSPDVEVVNLVTTLNQLLRTVNETAAMKSRFYSAASHELRGPLQVLAGRVELTLGLPRSREDYQAALLEVQEQADHLIALVQSLLLMNRLEREDARTGAVELFLLAPLCHVQIAALAPQIRARQLTVALHASLGELPELRAVAASHGEILIRNLLDNAVRYTPNGGTIRIGASFLPNAAMLEIVNPALQLASSEIARLTEPFYRPDPSRNVQTGGSGLGLSICQTLCDLNGWKLSLFQNVNDFHATVAFPSIDTEAA